MPTSTVKHIALCTLWLFCLKPVTAQTDSITRLIGTKSEYYLNTLGWLESDSSRLVYTIFGTEHQTPLYTYIHPGLVDNLPLITGQDAPYYYTGMYPTSESYRTYSFSPWMADSIISYWYDVWPDTSVWSAYQWLHMTYETNKIDSIYYQFQGSRTTFNIDYNANQQPVFMQTINPSAKITKNDFYYQPEGLNEYARSSNYYGTLERTESEHYELRDDGRPIEQIAYAYADGEAAFSSRWTYTYNTSGKVAQRTLWTQADGVYYETDVFDYTYAGDLVTKHTIIHRQIDTTTSPVGIGEWDSTLRLELYFTDTRIDSMKRYKQGFGETEMELELIEQFFYTGDLLSNYYAYNYDNGNLSDAQTIIHTYNANGQLVERSLQIEYPTYCHLYDTLYSYNNAGFITKKEVFEKTSYDVPCMITETNPTERHFYYYESLPIVGSGDDYLNVQVYPNPASDQITIFIAHSGENNDEQNIQIIDLSGKKVLYKKLPGDVSQTLIDCSVLAAGVYTVSVTNANHIATQKIVIQ